MPAKATHDDDAAPRVDPVSAALVVVGGFVLLVGSWIFLHSGLYGEEISDLALYQRYGEAVLDGEVPYRDFGLGYPPVAIPIFVLPALAAASDYRGLFEFLMILSAEAALGFTVVTLRSLGATIHRLVAAAAFIGLAPLALGTVVLTRYDFWPAALTSAALAALITGRRVLAGGALAAAVAAKLYAVVLLPLVLLYAARRSARGAVGVFLAFVFTVAVFTLPFALGQGNLYETAELQTVDRPLQIESLGSSVLLAAHQLGAYSASAVQAAGVQGLAGSLPDRLADAMTGLQILAVVLVWVLFWRGPVSRERFLLASAAAVAGFIAFGKVLSPQYLIADSPGAARARATRPRGRRAPPGGIAPSTQAWFPSRYFDLVELGQISWLVLIRNLVLVALFVVLTLGLRTRTGET